jgi:hypothetical protein
LVQDFVFIRPTIEKTTEAQARFDNYKKALQYTFQHFTGKETVIDASQQDQYYP